MCCILALCVWNMLFHHRMHADSHKKGRTESRTHIQPPSCFEGSSGGASGVRNDGKLSSENASRPFFVVPAKCVLPSLFFLSSHLHTPHRGRRGVRFDGAHHHHPALVQENTPGAHKMSTLCVCCLSRQDWKMGKNPSRTTSLDTVS